MAGEGADDLGDLVEFLEAAGQRVLEAAGMGADGLLEGQALREEAGELFGHPLQRIAQDDGAARLLFLGAGRHSRPTTASMHFCSCGTLKGFLR